MSRKTKNSLLRRFLCTGLVLLMLLPSLPAFAVSQSPFNESTYDAAMTDEEGYNIIGNTPEQLAQGGFYAPQKDWLFYADWTQNGVLCASNGSRTVILTDYPVANINVSGDRLVFTDLSATVSRRYAADNTFAHDKLTYGGKLYEATGVKALMSGGELGAIRQIGNDAYYYRVGLGKDIYALSGSTDVSNWSYVRVADGEITPIVVGSEGESIVNMVDNYMVLYFEIESPGEWGRILRLDATTRQLVDSVPGRELSVLGERIFFISNTNHYLYEMKSNTSQPTVVSSCPVASYAIQDNGDIKALGADGQVQLLISLNSNYEGFAGPYQVGEWCNYFKMQYARPKDEEEEQEEDFIEFTWLTDTKIHIVCVYPPEPPPTSSQPPKDPIITSQSKKMPPEVAVEMVMTMIKGGTTDDDIFNRYYDANAKAVFMEYFENLVGGRYSMENLVDIGISMLGEDMFTEAHKARFTEIFKNYFAQIEYTLKTLEEKESTALVRMHLTKTLDLDLNHIDLSESALMSHLANYMTEQGLDQSYLRSFTDEAALTDFILGACFDYLEKALVPLDVSQDIDINLVTHKVLTWVIASDAKAPTSPPPQPPPPPPPPPPPGMCCLYNKLIYERETPNMWQVLGREAKKLWNNFWGIETPKYEPVDTYLRTELVCNNILPGINFCPKELKVIVPGKPKSTWEMIKSWFS